MTSSGAGFRYGLAAFLCLLPLGAESSRGAAQPVWQGNAAMDANFHLFWKHDKTSITMEIQAKTLGYVGIGISPTGKMVDADIIAGYVKDGKAVLKDRFSQGYDTIVDDKQDCTLISGSENGTHTTLRFKRPLKTGDAHDKDIVAGPLMLIYAYHPDDPLNTQSLHYHERTRGAKTVTLF